MSGLSPQLRSLVHFAVDILGQAIKNSYGDKRYLQVEDIRQNMKKLRRQKNETLSSSLKRELRKMGKYSESELYELSHAFGTYLEIINRCETAYRHLRLEQRGSSLQGGKKPYAIINVFTAHPTEARSLNLLDIFERIEATLKEVLLHGQSPVKREELSNLIGLVLRLSLAKKARPTVQNEADYIYSIVLHDAILEKQVSLYRQGVNLLFRTWVGGDKDGHPFVDEKTLVDSFNLSRSRLQRFVAKHLESSLELLSKIDKNEGIKSLQKTLKALVRDLEGLSSVRPGDGAKVVRLREKFEKCYEAYHKEFTTRCPHLSLVKDIFWLYPALLLPLEVREDAELVHEATKDKEMSIAKMLLTTRKVAKGHNPKWYVRGFVISMVQSDEDVLAGSKLLRQTLGELSIPVVPLFETEQALLDSRKILTGLFERDKDLYKEHQTRWQKRFELMLGYSDSSKESGVLRGRWLIAQGLRELDRFLRSKDLVPVFFHGSGGSVERGGGSIKEQTQWWPQSALNIFKATVQGEMVARNFGDPLIMQSVAEKIVNELRPKKSRGPSKSFIKAMDEFSERAGSKYKNLIEKEYFREIVQAATPYQYLDQLRIGSRPGKRPGSGKEFRLRAIPWVLCWTQTRLLLPSWFGVGSAWEELDKDQRYEILKGRAQSDFLTSFVKIMGFTLAKIELGVFKLYLDELSSTKEDRNFYQLLQSELKKTQDFVREVSGKEDLLWFRPWLGESIALRSSMIHPLNLVQIEALRRRSGLLLRETVTGVACGMMTTG